MSIWLCSACASRRGGSLPSKPTSATPVSSHDDSMPRRSCASLGASSAASVGLGRHAQPRQARRIDASRERITAVRKRVRRSSASADGSRQMSRAHRPSDRTAHRAERRPSTLLRAVATLARARHQRVGPHERVPPRLLARTAGALPACGPPPDPQRHVAPLHDARAAERQQRPEAPRGHPFHRVPRSRRLHVRDARAHRRDRAAACRA